MRAAIYASLLLVGSNLFMTYAWYGHLRDQKDRSLLVVILLSWGVAFFEYCLMVPANRIGFQTLSLGQLKIIQEVIGLAVFGAFSFFYMKEGFRLDYVWAFLCILGAVYFVFRGGAPGAH